MELYIGYRIQIWSLFAESSQFDWSILRVLADWNLIQYLDDDISKVLNSTEAVNFSKDGFPSF